MRYKDAMQFLGCKPGAGKEEIRQAYRKLAKVCHPDAGGSSYDFCRLREAYETAMSYQAGPEPEFFYTESSFGQNQNKPFEFDLVWFLLFGALLAFVSMYLTLLYGSSVVTLIKSFMLTTADKIELYHILAGAGLIYLFLNCPIRTRSAASYLPLLVFLGIGYYLYSTVFSEFIQALTMLFNLF